MSMDLIQSDFSFTGLRNAEHDYFNQNALQVITAEFASQNGLASLRATYADAVAAENMAHNVTNSFEDTPEVAALDRERDKAFILLCAIVSAYADYSADETTQKAAARLDFLLTGYRNASRKSFVEETDLLTDLCGRMEADEYKGCLETLHLTEVAARVKEQNDLFNDLYKKRSAELLERAKTVSSKELRKASDTAFRALAEGINAVYTVNSLVTKDTAKEAALAAVIDGVNQLIVQLRQVVRARGGKAGALDPVDPTEPTDPTKPTEPGEGDSESPDEI